MSESDKFTITNLASAGNVVSFNLAGPAWDSDIPLLALDADHAEMIKKRVEALYLSGIVVGMNKVMPKWQETIDCLATGFSNELKVSK